jgi:hypothetical protein
VHFGATSSRHVDVRLGHCRAVAGSRSRSSGVERGWRSRSPSHAKQLSICMAGTWAARLLVVCLLLSTDCGGYGAENVAMAQISSGAHGEDAGAEVGLGAYTDGCSPEQPRSDLTKVCRTSHIDTIAAATDEAVAADAAACVDGCHAGRCCFDASVRAGSVPTWVPLLRHGGVGDGREKTRTRILKKVTRDRDSCAEYAPCVVLLLNNIPAPVTDDRPYTTKVRGRVNRARRGGEDEGSGRREDESKLVRAP